MGIQTITDERLMFKNMQNIRIAYIIQTLGMMGILTYYFAVEGLDGLKANLVLFILFILSAVVLAFLSRSGDERVVKENLQKIRYAYVAQIIGVIGILAYDFITKGGYEAMTKNPLWLVFTISLTTLVFLSLGISVDHENKKKSSKRELIISLIIVLLVCAMVGVATSLSEGQTIANGVLTAGVFFVCGSAPFIIVYNLRKNRNKHLEE